MNQTDIIMYNLDAWVLRHGNGCYFNPYPPVGVNCFEMPGFLHEEFGIQQVREEISEFVNILLNRKYKSIIEIGLGQFGSTHFLWRQFFDKVITIEKSFERVREFGNSMKKYYQRWVFEDNKSWFFTGMSNESKIVKDIYYHIHQYGGIDVLFIDGDHSEESVLSDWLLYSPLVNDGGIIAFHDTVSNKFSGATNVVNMVCNGTIDGKKRNLNTIFQSDVCGISYYYNQKEKS